MRIPQPNEHSTCRFEHSCFLCFFIDAFITAIPHSRQRCSMTGVGESALAMIFVSGPSAATTGIEEAQFPGTSCPERIADALPEALDGRLDARACSSASKHDCLCPAFQCAFWQAREQYATDLHPRHNRNVTCSSTAVHPGPQHTLLKSSRNVFSTPFSATRASLTHLP